MVSSKARSLQSQLYYALVFQIIIPTVLLNVPLAVFFVLTLLNRGPGEYSAYLSLLITLYPVIDPLPNFFIISPYRKAAFAKSQSMQSQLFYALVFQTLIPALLLHFPVSVMFGFVLASHGLGIYSCIISITISFYPAIDPLPNFFIISPYRKAAFRCFKRNWQSSEVNQVPPNSKNVVAPANVPAI
ncbi:hypothetical protein B9Z55_013731 [Caenorhabditis nigoni]|nr:hypothetical protein B9Z55_013731 [Caenorhabditis nigoni]